MDSELASQPSRPLPSLHLPDWTLAHGIEADEADAAFAAGTALKTFDDLVRAAPIWAGCWRARQALKCAAAAVRLMGRGENENALRDAVLLTARGDDPGPAGKVFWAYKKLAVRKPAFSSKTVVELADLLGLALDDNALATILDHADAALQARRPPPIAAAGLVSVLHAAYSQAEPLAWILGDMLIAAKLKWDHPVPLLMAERYGPAFRVIGGRGRIYPGEPNFARAVCRAMVLGTQAALQSAVEIDRHAARLLAVAPKLRTKGAARVIEELLDEDAMSASASGTGLSRWASTRLFERLESFGAVREVSGRSSFRIFGL